MTTMLEVVEDAFEEAGLGSVVWLEVVGWFVHGGKVGRWESGKVAA